MIRLNECLLYQHSQSCACVLGIRSSSDLLEPNRGGCTPEPCTICIRTACTFVTHVCLVLHTGLSALRRVSLPVFTRNLLSHSLSYPPPSHAAHSHHRPATPLLPGAGPQITKLPPLSPINSPSRSHTLTTPNNRQKSPRHAPTPKRPSKSQSRSVSIAKPAAPIGESAMQIASVGYVGAPPQQGSSQGQSSSMDGEIAKALKVFFRDVKGVRKKMAELKNLGK